MATLKEVASTVKIVTQVALEKAFRDLKNYIDTQDQNGSSAAQQAIQAVREQLNALIGTEDADKVINTFNEIKAFLADYTEDYTLKSLIDAVNTAISNETTRATGAENTLSAAISTEATRAKNAESALSGRVTTLENVNVMTAEEAKALFDSVFNE